MTKHHLTTCLRFVHAHERDLVREEDALRARAKAHSLAEDLIFQLLHARDEGTSQNVTLDGETYSVTIKKL